jgi:putative spermidine/putrescine transport system ATP-binding protein
MYETPANRFVAGFVGDNTVFDGIVADTSADQCTVVLPCGTQLRGLNVNAAQESSAAQACIRPERIAVHTPSSRPTDNCIEASVRDIIYFGDHLRLRCAVCAQTDACVKIPISGKAAPQAGQTVWLHLPPEHLRIYL